MDSPWQFPPMTQPRPCPGEEWAYARLYLSESERVAAYATFIHTYNHHRGHTALGGKSPADRVPNLRGQYT